MHALDGGFMRPAPGGDLLRAPDILPTGRNIHGFDPFRLPSRLRRCEGRRRAGAALVEPPAWPMAGRLPETIAMVLWGTDNLKSEGAQIAQVLALLGATTAL